MLLCDILLISAVQEPHPRLLVMGAALMCSGAMGLAVSGFPNMTAIAKEDPTGNPWLSNVDFFKVRAGPCTPPFSHLCPSHSSLPSSQVAVKGPR